MVFLRLARRGRQHGRPTEAGSVSRLGSLRDPVTVASLGPYFQVVARDRAGLELGRSQIVKA